MPNVDSSERIQLEIERIKQKEETKRILGKDPDYQFGRCARWAVVLAMVGATCCTSYSMCDRIQKTKDLQMGAPGK